MMNRRAAFQWLGLALFASLPGASPAQENEAAEQNKAAQESQAAQIFSGPQKGEAIERFNARIVLGGQVGENFDPVAVADGKPLVLLFLHEVTRPSVGLTRAVMTYADRQRERGLQAAVVLVSADASQSEQWVSRAKYALPENTPIAVYTQGAEGPGAYGLNRKVAITVLVAKENKVVANFALVQPSLTTDGLKIAEAIAEVTGAKPPTAAELEQLSRPGRAMQKRRQ